MTAIRSGAAGMSPRPYNSRGPMNIRAIIVFVVRCSMRALLGPVTVLLALAVLPACGLIAAVGVSGRVVDRETGQAIEGAVTSLWRTAHCASFHAYSRHLPPAEARTDAAGRFSVGRGRTATTAGCLSTAWSRTLRILSPGYVAASFSQDDPWLG